MKILIVQLARLGDIYMTWPSVRALRRTHPEAQIDILVRPRFAGALEGLSEIDTCHLLPTKQIMSPLLEAQFDIDTAASELSHFVGQMKDQNYDWIINLSYSPFSSYLTASVASPEARVTGYTRHSDGHLSIPDDISAYFYAQVRVAGFNRFHLTDIFAETVGIALQESDWQPPAIDTSSAEAYDILIHVGASDPKKAISAAKWTSVLSYYLRYRADRIALVGSSQEVAIAEEIMSSINSPCVHNLVGKTNLTQLFATLSKAQLLVGCDSSPMHMASLTNTPCLNISLLSVNFWETGPRAINSVVMLRSEEDEFNADEISDTMAKILRGNQIVGEYGFVTQRQISPAYDVVFEDQFRSQWELIKSIYTGSPFEPIDEGNFYKAVFQLKEVNEVLLSQLLYVEKTGNLANVAGIIDRCEEVIHLLGKADTHLRIIVDWYETEKIRVAPGSQTEILAKNLETQKMLKTIVDIYANKEMQELYVSGL